MGSTTGSRLEVGKWVFRRCRDATGTAAGNTKEGYNSRLLVVTTCKPMYNPEVKHEVRTAHEFCLTIKYYSGASKREQCDR